MLCIEYSRPDCRLLMVTHLSYSGRGRGGYGGRGRGGGGFGAYGVLPVPQQAAYGMPMQ